LGVLGKFSFSTIVLSVAAAIVLKLRVPQGVLGKFGLQPESHVTTSMQLPDNLPGLEYFN
jgi:hypothetical protein